MAKLMMIIILAAGTWVGVKADRFLLKERCLDAGGAVAANGICIGAAAP